jgi:hypothetical protein
MGAPLTAGQLTAGQHHESAFFTELMDQVRVPRPVGRPKKRPEAARGRPGLRLEREPTVVLEEKHRVGNYGSKRDAHRTWKAADLRRREIQATERHRAANGPFDGAQTDCHPV